MVKIRKPPFLKGIGKCIFCGGTGLSKEHVFGDWLKEFFPRDARITHTSAEIRWSKHILTEHPIDERRKRQGHSGSLKLRVVCEQCNNGWLSRLEASAKETLRPLILGFRGALLPEAQTRVAVWAAKTAMVATNFRPRIPEITREECSFLMREGRPPDTNWYVWIAPYSGTIWRHLTIFQDRGGLSPKPLHNGDLAPYYIQATTFGLGHVLFTALSSVVRPRRFRPVF